MTSWGDIENPAYTAGKNYSEPPQRYCYECRWYMPNECVSEHYGLCCYEGVACLDGAYNMDDLRELLFWQRENSEACERWERR